MKTVYNLFLTKQLSILKNIFRKPVSSVLTIIGVLFFLAIVSIGLLIPHESSFVERPELFALLAVGVTVFFIFSMMLNTKGKKALLMAEDAFYLFTIPVDQKATLLYVILNNLLTALGTGLYVVFMVAAIGGTLVQITIPLLIIVFITTTISALLVLNMQDYFYLLKIDNIKNAKIIKIICLAILGVIIALLVPTFFQYDFGTTEGKLALLNAPVINLIPIIGWQKAIIASFIAHSWLSLCGYSILLLMVLLGTSWLLMEFKGSFYEQALTDSEELTAAYREAKKGRIALGKVKERHVKFALNEWAFFSKAILIMKKSGEYIKKTDLLIVIVYAVIVFLSKGDYSMFSTMMMFWVFISIMQSSIKDELKTPYIYLAPGKPFKKMLAIILPLFISPVILILFYNILGMFVFRTDFLEVILTILRSIGFIPVIFAGNVLSLRLLKSSSNQVVENLMRFGIVLLSLIPTFIITLAAIIMGSTSAAVGIIVSFSTIILNASIGIAILWICSPMLRGFDIEG